MANLGGILRRVAGMVEDAAPVVTRGIGDNGGPSMLGLEDILRLRSEQMALKPNQRIQPNPAIPRMIDQNYSQPAPFTDLPDLSTMYPRNADPAAALPLGDRARVLVDRKDEISSALANAIRQSGQMDSPTRYFYNSDGPLYRAAREAGLSEDEALTFVQDFASRVAATSPRTDVTQNVRNASLAMSKDAQGIPLREIVGSGSGGISEHGYPMMTGDAGIHGKLIDMINETGGINPYTNTKPSMFAANVGGNRSGATVDTHAIRGILMTLNDMDAGSVPLDFIETGARDAYLADPTSLVPNMIRDTVGQQVADTPMGRMKVQTEYPVFADILHGAADQLGVSPAEAQSMAWFGLGDRTNLGSEFKTLSDVVDDRINVTAQAAGVSPEVVRNAFFRRQIPLMSVPAAGVMGAAIGGQGNNRSGM